MSRLWKQTFLLMVLLIFFKEVGARDFPMIRYDINNGLPANMTYAVYRDSKGFIWIATDKGIARYNGIKFEVFTTFNGLADNEIFFFQEDPYGRIWFGTYNGELCYYQDGVFHSARNTPFLKRPFLTPFIRQISVEEDSSITIVYNDNFKLLNIKGEKVTPIRLDTKLDNIHRFELVYTHKLKNGNYRLLFRNGQYIVDSAGNVIGNSDSVYIRSLDLSKGAFTQNRFYVHSTTGIYTPDLKFLIPFTRNFIHENYLYQVYNDGKDYFLTTNHGIFVSDTIHILPGKKVSGITQDKRGNYWITTLGDGVYMLSRDFRNAGVYGNAYDGTVRSARMLRGKVVFATSGSEIRELSHDAIIPLFDFSKYTMGNMLYQDKVFYIDSNARGYFYFDNGQIVVDDVLDPKSKVSHYLSDINLVGSVKTMLARGHHVFLNTRNNILEVDFDVNKPGSFIKYSPVTDKATSGRIFCMEKAPDGHIWFSTASNVYKIVDGKYVIQSGFGNVSFKSFVFFGADLVGYTQDNRLLVCSNYDDKVIVDSVPSQNCIWDRFFTLDDHHLLVSTNNMYRLMTFYQPNTNKKFSVSTIEDQFVPCNAEFVVADSAVCYFFKEGDVSALDLADLFEKADPPELFFNILKTGKKLYNISTEMEIPFSEAKNVVISFNQLLFSGKDIVCQYSVSRNETDIWHDVATPEINILNAGFGDYTVKIRGRSASSDFSVPVSFTLHVLRPYWATWWFILSCLGAAVIVVVVIYRRRVQLVLKKKQREHDSEIRFLRSEYKAMNALMNPHFIFNTLNNVQGLVNRNDRLAANEYLRVFSDLIRQNMHNISRELIPLRKEVDLVNNYLLLEKLRFKEHLNYRFDIDKDLDLSEIMVSPLLLQPIVENSIKHGILPLESANGCVRISIFVRDGDLHIEVADNGIGMARSRARSASGHESFGLDNIRKRIEQLSVIQNKEIKLEISERSDSANITWTIVAIIMPVSLN